jgi:hypothetical protein
MALPYLATTAELEVRVGRPFTAKDQPLAEEILRDVSAVIRLEAGNDFVTLDGELDLPDAVRAVMLIVARRAFMNPRRISSNQISGYSERTHDAESMGIFLHDTEKRMLRAALGRTNAGSISVPLARAYVDPTIWAYASQGFDPIPMEEA